MSLILEKVLAKLPNCAYPFRVPRTKHSGASRMGWTGSKDSLLKEHVMSRKGFIGLVSAAVLSLAIGGCGSTGSGVEAGAFGTYLDGGDLGTGWGAGAKLEMNPIDLVSIDGRVSWVNFDDADVDVFPLELAGLINLPLFGESIVPYAGAGVGYYWSQEDWLDSKWGFFPLVGLEFGPQNFSMMAEARWLFLEADALGGAAKADADGFGANLGLIWRF